MMQILLDIIDYMLPIIIIVMILFVGILIYSNHKYHGKGIITTKTYVKNETINGDNETYTIQTSVPIKFKSFEFDNVETTIFVDKETYDQLQIGSWFDNKNKRGLKL